jgi:hypothetical protein
VSADLKVSPDTTKAETAVGTGQGRKIVNEVALALAIYGMLGWIYVGICALVAPQTLALPLTHLLPHLREDTSGFLSFVVSFAGFITYRLTRRN